MTIFKATHSHSRAAIIFAISLSIWLAATNYLLPESCRADAPQDALHRQPSLRPNILLIVADDQRYDQMGLNMPLTQTQIFDAGVTFSHAYITTPACCPSRSSILTGMYAHNHGVHLNSMKLTHHTFVEKLKADGYFTGIVGKYLNSWSGVPRPEFDSWVSFPFGSTKYFDPTLSVDGELKNHAGYLTHLLRDYALDFLDRAGQHPEPFFLYFTPFTPHGPALPAPEDSELFLDIPPLRPANYLLRLPLDPPWLRNAKILSDLIVTRIDRLRVRQFQTLASLDRAIDSLLEKLREQKRLENTLVIYISDNGLMLGEHNLGGKECGYEPAIHVPMAIRYPALISTPHVDTNLVANIDIAPTIFQIIGLPTPSRFDGVSLVPLLKGRSKPVREALLVEGWKKGPARSPFVEVHTLQHAYIETPEMGRELYDLNSDPDEIHNLSGLPEYAALEKSLRDTLVKLATPHTPARANDSAALSAKKLPIVPVH